LSAFGACRTDRARQTEWIPRHRHAIDDHGFERKAIDARIAATYGRIVFRQSAHASADRQVANAAFAFRIGGAFDTQGLAIGFDGFAFHLRAELAVGTTIARRSCASIGRRTRLTVFPVALFAFGTIRIDLAFIAGLRNRITGESTRAVGIRSTSAASDLTIQIDAKRSIPTAGRTCGTAKLVRIARRAQRGVIAIITGHATIVARLIHQRPIALLTDVQIRERRIAAQGLEKRRRGK